MLMSSNSMLNDGGQTSCPSTSIATRQRPNRRKYFLPERERSSDWQDATREWLTIPDAGVSQGFLVWTCPSVPTPSS